VVFRQAGYRRDAGGNEARQDCPLGISDQRSGGQLVISKQARYSVLAAAGRLVGSVVQLPRFQYIHACELKTPLFRNMLS